MAGVDFLTYFVDDGELFRCLSLSRNLCICAQNAWCVANPQRWTKNDGGRLWTNVVECGKSLIGVTFFPVRAACPFSLWLYTRDLSSILQRINYM